MRGMAMRTSDEPFTDCPPGLPRELALAVVTGASSGATVALLPVVVPTLLSVLWLALLLLVRLLLPLRALVSLTTCRPP